MGTKLFVVLLILIILRDGWWCNGEAGGVGAPMVKTEQEALYSAIQGFVGDWWNGSDLYPDPCGWTPIQGVSCDFMDGFWYVTDLNIGPLHDNSLTCSQNPEFKPQIFELNHLKSLSFFNCFNYPNSLISLPTYTWEKLAIRLESLEFRSNPSLTGPIPSNFCNLEMLQSFVLIENGFTGKIPAEIGNLRRLKRLVLSGNRFTGQIPDAIGNLNELLILDLSRNSLSGHLPFSIGYLNSLLKLDLSNNMLVGKIPIEIGKLKNLILLDLRNNSFSGGLTRSLEEMNSLQELVLSSNLVGGDIEKMDWQKLHNLMILDLSNLRLTGRVPMSITKLKKLRYLGLGNNLLTGKLPPELANMACVGAIYVNGNNFSGELEFPEGFYGKLRRRFGAWNNPNLCYPGGLMSTGYAPLGVQPCNSNGLMNNLDLKLDFGSGFGYLNPEIMPSLALSSYGTNGFWWIIFLVEAFMMGLLWDYFS